MKIRIYFHDNEEDQLVDLIARINNKEYILGSYNQEKIEMNLPLFQDEVDQNLKRFIKARKNDLSLGNFIIFTDIQKSLTYEDMLINVLKDTARRVFG
jgi:hypothetical protein